MPASYRLKLLSARETSGDVGADLEGVGDRMRSDLIGLISANAQRVQQALRVLEETAKLPANRLLEHTKFKKARFSIYNLEKKLISAFLRIEKREKIKGL